MIPRPTPTWSECVESYRLVFQANRPFESEGTHPFELAIIDGAGERAGEGHFKLRRGGFYDSRLDQEFDVLVISQIELIESLQRFGVGTEIVRRLAVRFPNALFVGESHNDRAVRWHEDRLNKRFPTRMIQLADGGEKRVTPGQPIDEAEL